jgi:hypothetical protein
MQEASLRVLVFTWAPPFSSSSFLSFSNDLTGLPYLQHHALSSVPYSLTMIRLSRMQAMVRRLKIPGENRVVIEPVVLPEQVCRL